MGMQDLFQKRAIEGITRFAARQRPQWAFEFSRWPVPIESDEYLLQQRFSGILTESALLRHCGVRDQLRSRRIPTVSIGLSVDSFPCVCSDDRKVSKAAFEHLRSRGFRRFAFFYDEFRSPFLERCSSFRRAVLDAGFDFVEQPNAETQISWDSRADADRLHAWVERLPTPIAVFCGNVQRGFIMLTACNKLGIRVPDEVAVLGCDHDETVCNLTNPPLSTIDHGMERVGYEAALLLDRLMNGEAEPHQPVLVDPVGVIERQSTDTLAVENDALREALNFIEQYALDGITPSDVLEQVDISRRGLEMLFQKDVGRTIQQQILHRRLDYVKHLLVDTEMKMPDIAAAAGFAYSSHLQTTFKRVTGSTPGAYRRKYRSAGNV